MSKNKHSGVSPAVHVCACVTVFLCYSNLVCCHRNRLSGGCGWPVFSPNVCCQTHGQENSNLCPTSSAAFSRPTIWLCCCCRGHTWLSQSKVNSVFVGQKDSLNDWVWPITGWTDQRMLPLYWIAPYLLQGHSVGPQCLLLTICGRNSVGVMRAFIWITDTALNLFYKQGLCLICVPIVCFLWKTDPD